MSTLAVRAYYHPGLMDEDEAVEDIVFARATVLAAKSGRTPVWPPSAVAHTPTRDGLVQVDALFDTEAIR